MGDTAWSIQHAFDSRHCFTPRIGSEFLYHDKAYAAADFEARSQVEQALLGLARRTFAAAAPEAPVIMLVIAVVLVVVKPF